MTRGKQITVENGETIAVPKLHRFIDVIVPVKTCNLRCHYCYITHNRLFESSLPECMPSPETIASSLSQRRFGGVCLINFCGGGETLLPPQMPDIIRAVLGGGHFVMVVTNGTVTSSLKRIAEFPKEYLDRLLFKFSFHFLELKKRGLLDRFCENVRRMRNAGASISVEITPSDELVPYIDEVKDVCLREFGALCHVTVARDEKNKSKIPILTSLPKADYRRIWRSFDSPLFDFKMSVFGEKRRDFCYAGKWTYFLQMETGLLFQCYGGCSLQNIYDNTRSTVRELPIGHLCPLPHCYNAHVFLSLGTIAGREDPAYAVLRNRICSDGTEWLRPRMKSFLSQKIDQNNARFSAAREVFADLICSIVAINRVLLRFLRKIVNICMAR